MARQLSFWALVALIVGTQIGAGILGLPHVVAPLGPFWGSVVLFLGAVLMASTAVMLVEALYLTNPRYHYFDLAEHYLGRLGFLLVLFVVFSSYFALIAYVVGLGDVLHAVATHYGFPDLGAAGWAVLSWALLSLVVFAGLRVSSAAEGSLTLFIVLIILTIVLWALPHISFPPVQHLDFRAFTVAFNVGVFAYFAHVIVPEIIQSSRKLEKTVGAIITAFGLSFVLYTGFALAVAGVLHGNVPEIGTLGLVNVVDPGLAVLALVLPLLTIVTSYIGVGIALVDMLNEIIRNRTVSWFLAVVPPLLVALSGSAGFISSLSIGAIGIILAGGILPAVLFIMARNERRRHVLPIPTWYAWLSATIFSLILVYSLFAAL